MTRSNVLGEFLRARRERVDLPAFAEGRYFGQLLVIFHAEPGSESARSLALLGSLSAPALGSSA